MAHLLSATQGRYCCFEYFIAVGVQVVGWSRPPVVVATLKLLFKSSFLYEPKSLYIFTSWVPNCISIAIICLLLQCVNFFESSVGTRISHLPCQVEGFYEYWSRIFTSLYVHYVGTFSFAFCLTTFCVVTDTHLPTNSVFMTI